MCGARVVLAGFVGVKICTRVCGRTSASYIRSPSHNKLPPFNIQFQRLPRPARRARSVVTNWMAQSERPRGKRTHSASSSAKHIYTHTHMGHSQRKILNKIYISRSACASTFTASASSSSALTLVADGSVSRGRVCAPSPDYPLSIIRGTVARVAQKNEHETCTRTHGGTRANRKTDTNKREKKTLSTTQFTICLGPINKSHTGDRRFACVCVR